MSSQTECSSYCTNYVLFNQSRSMSSCPVRLLDDNKRDFVISLYIMFFVDWSSSDLCETIAHAEKHSIIQFIYFCYMCTFIVRMCQLKMCNFKRCLSINARISSFFYRTSNGDPYPYYHQYPWPRGSWCSKSHCKNSSAQSGSHTWSRTRRIPSFFPVKGRRQCDKRCRGVPTRQLVGHILIQWSRTWRRGRIS